MCADTSIVTQELNQKLIQHHGIPVHPEAQPRDRFSLVLLKKASWLGPQYIMERREWNDPVYAGRFALFGGTRKEDETWEAVAVREVAEETGKEIAQADLVMLFHFDGENDIGHKIEGAVFVYTFPLWARGITTRDIRRFQKGTAEKLKETDDHIGEPVIVRRLLWNWFPLLDWTHLTPQAVHALVADFDRDKRRRLDLLRKQWWMRFLMRAFATRRRRETANK